MAIIRKKKIIDAMDREILRQMYTTRRYLTGNQIAKQVRLSPSALAPRLNNLRSQGIIRQTEVKGLRSFSRKFAGIPRPVRINAPRSILWGLDIKKEKKKFLRGGNF